MTINIAEFPQYDDESQQPQHHADEAHPEGVIGLRAVESLGQASEIKGRIAISAVLAEMRRIK